MISPRFRTPISVRRRVWLGTAAAALVCGTSTAHAGSTFSVHAFVSAYADTIGAQNSDSGVIPGPTATAGPLDLVSGDREASIFAQAGYGHLTGNAFATNPNGSIAAQAGTLANRFVDTISIHSGTLSAGSQVMVLASLTFNNVLIQQANAGLTSEFDLAPLGTFDDRGNGTGTITNSHTNSIVLTEFVDTPFLIAAELGFDVSARPGMGEVQFADARYTLDVLTPGATLDSASGQSYSSVPEPGSVVMLVAGICGLYLLRKQKGRSFV
jgi:hypothetical protein